MKNSNQTRKWMLNLITLYITLKFATLMYLVTKNNAFEPDESTYSEVVCLFNETGLVPQQVSYYLRWGPTFLFSGQFFNFLGFSCLDALRVSSFVFATLSACIMAYFFIEIAKRFPFSIKSHQHSVLAFSFYLFYPSKFFWTSLGLRESVIEFTILIVFLALFKLTQESKTFVYLSVLILSLIILNLTRQFLFYAVIIAISFSILYINKHKILFCFFLVMTTVVAFFLPSLIVDSYTSYYLAQKNLEIKKIEKTIESLRKDLSTSPLVNSQLQKKLNSAKLLRENAIEFATENQDIYREIPEPETVRYARSIDARSKIATKDCLDPREGLRESILCNLTHTPNGLYSVILRPNPIHDWYSIATRIASVENVLFVIAFVLILRITMKVILNRSFYSLKTPLIIFVYSCLFGMALYEGNVGTSLRHRLILISIFSLIFILNSFSPSISRTTIK